MNSEKKRIEFLENRDGKEGAKKFAEQTLAIYTQAALQESRFYESIKFLKEYVGIKQ